MDYVRTSFELSVELLEEAYSIMPNHTKRSVIEKALEEFIENHKRKNLNDIRDKINFADYDYKAARSYGTEEVYK